MSLLEIIKLCKIPPQVTRWVVFPGLLLGLLLLAATARGAAYYSSGAPVVATPTRNCSVVGVCGTGVDVSAAGTSSSGIAVVATVYISNAGPARLRLQLNGTALAGYRAGMLLSTTSAVLGAKSLGVVTLRTFLSTPAAPVPTTPQDERVVDADAAQAQLGASKGQPAQLELLSTKDFDQVEIEFAQAVNVGTGVNIHYAYGIGKNAARQVPGYVSRFSTPGDGQYNVSGTCGAGIVNPANAVDANLNNYAQFAILASVNCAGQLSTRLEGTAPGTYRAGFVIGNTTNLLDADILGGLVLRTYDSNGNPLETGTGTSLLNLSVLPDGKSLVSFQATKAFSYVSIERAALVSTLDNLQLFYGVGLASAATTAMVLSSFSDGTGHYKVYQSGLVCVGGCGVTTPKNAAGPDKNAPATIQQTVAGASATTLALDLNSPDAGPAGKAGNRAGMLIQNKSLADATALSNITLLTYDAAGNVLETGTGSTLLAVNVLPDGRQTISFNTTKDFASVGIQVGSALSLLASTDVFYAFADNSSGSISLVPPAPLPVSLSSLAVRRLAGTEAAEISWATASEVNSAYFVVERSANPAAGFQAIGQVAAAGSSVGVRRYSLRDGAASPGTTLYYRLRQVDTDGSVVFSGAVVLAAGSSPTSFSLYPNPATASAGRVAVSVGAALAPGTSLSVYSSTGQLLSERVVGDNEAALTVPTTGLALGIYHVVLRNAAGQPLASQRLLVTGN